MAFTRVTPQPGRPVRNESGSGSYSPSRATLPSSTPVIAASQRLGPVMGKPTADPHSAASTLMKYDEPQRGGPHRGGT